VKESPISQEGVLEIAGKGSNQVLAGLQGGRIETASQDVIRIVILVGAWTAKRMRLVGRYLIAATLADESRE
jgi:hypothetical protein